MVFNSKEYNKQYSIKYNDAHVKQRLLSLAKYRAKKQGLKFDLTIEDIKIPKYCPVLGIKLIRGIASGMKCSPSIDRINPRKGYVKGNIQIISYKANTMKSNASIAELKRFAKRIINFTTKD